MSIRQANPKSAIFVPTAILHIKDFSFNHMYVVNAMVK